MVLGKHASIIQGVIPSVDNGIIPNAIISDILCIILSI